MKNRYSKEDRTALYITALLILCFIGTKWINNVSAPRPVAFPIVQESALLSSVAPASMTREENSWDDKPLQSSENQKQFFRFDPNTISRDSLFLLPIDKKALYNLLKYREKGGHFKTAKDLMKIYGMSRYQDKIDDYAQFESSQFKDKFNKNEELAPISSLEKSVTTSANTEIKNPIISPSQEKPDSTIMAGNPANLKKVESKTFEKRNEETIVNKNRVDINTADQYQLMLINGVGAFYSKLIVEYRDRIGGFYSRDQLLNIKGIQVDRARDWFDQIIIDETKIRKLNVNEASFKQLAALPNIGYKKGEILKLYLANNGKMNSIDQLLKVGVFDGKDIEVLAHYLSFN